MTLLAHLVQQHLPKSLERLEGCGATQGVFG